jgi:hypothetical protein
MALQPFVGPWPLLQFPNLFYTDGRTPWTGDQPVPKPLPTYRTTQTQNTRTQISMPCVGRILYRMLQIRLKKFKFMFMLFASVFICLLLQLNFAVTTHCEYGPSLMLSVECELRVGHLTCIMQSN